MVRIEEAEAAISRLLVTSMSQALKTLHFPECLSNATRPVFIVCFLDHAEMTLVTSFGLFPKTSSSKATEDISQLFFVWQVNWLWHVKWVVCPFNMLFVC